jgi:hypothetical protein
MENAHEKRGERMKTDNRKSVTMELRKEVFDYVKTMSEENAMKASDTINIMLEFFIAYVRHAKIVRTTSEFMKLRRKTEYGQLELSKRNATGNFKNANFI